MATESTLFSKAQHFVWLETSVFHGLALMDFFLLCFYSLCVWECIHRQTLYIAEQRNNLVSVTHWYLYH